MRERLRQPIADRTEDAPPRTIPDRDRSFVVLGGVEGFTEAVVAKPDIDLHAVRTRLGGHLQHEGLEMVERERLPLSLIHI